MMLVEKRERLSVEFIRECFEYVDGALYWRQRPARHFGKPADAAAFNTKIAGKKAGKVGSRGYVTIGLRINGRAISLAAHRVAWVLHYSKWPDHTIDHINRNRADNRMENLRDVPMHENLRNNGKQIGTGLRGVHRNNGRFASVARLGTQSIHLGTFDTPEEALQTRERAEDAALAAILAHRRLSRQPTSRQGAPE